MAYQLHTGSVTFFSWPTLNESMSPHRLERGMYELTIADDGVVLPAGYIPSQSRSVGITLIRGFSEQLGGELLTNSRHGLTITLAFGDEQQHPTFTNTGHAY